MEISGAYPGPSGGSPAIHSPSMTRADERSRKAPEERLRLIRRYIRLQRRLVEANPATPVYGTTARAFERAGHMLDQAGFEQDLDRLLYFQVLDGGLPGPAPRVARRAAPYLSSIAGMAGSG